VSDVPPPATPISDGDSTETAAPASLDVGALGRQGAMAMLFRTFVMRLITALGTIILARILIPEDFGVFAVLILVQNILSFVADFGLGPALVQQQHEPSREELATVWLMQQGTWIGFAAIIWFAAPYVAAQVPSVSPDFEWQLRAVIPSIAFAMLRSLPSAMLVRVLRFREVASIEVAGHVAFYLTAVSLALMGAGAWSFIAALACQTGIAAVLSNLAWRHWPGLHFSPGIAARLLRIGLAFQAANVALAGRDAVVPLFGGLGGGVAAIGFLQFALRISQLAAQVDQIVGRVAFPAFSRMKDDPTRTSRVQTDSIAIVCLLLGGTQAWMIATAPLLVPVVFGDQWGPAVLSLQLMCVGIMFSVPAKISGWVAFGQGKTVAGMAATVGGVGLLFALFGPFVVMFGLAGGGLAYAVAGLAGVVFQSWAVRSIAPFPWAVLLRAYGLAAAAGAASAVVATTFGGVIGLAAASAVFGAAYLVLALLFARDDLERSWRIMGMDRNPLIARLRQRVA